MTEASPLFPNSMSATDSVMWTIERDPELRSTVVVIILLDRPPDRDRLHSRLADAALQIPRLRQWVRTGWGDVTPRWVDDPNFHLGYHLKTIAAPSGADDRWLLDLAGSLGASAFDRSRPLWEMVVVENLDAGTAALVAKFHHSLTDGVGGVALMLSLLDFEPSGPEPEPRSRPAQVGPGVDRDARQSLVERGIRAATSIANPVHILREGVRTGISAARLAAVGGHRHSPVFVGHSLEGYFDCFDRSLDDFRQAGRQAGGSINDVFLAGLAGGLHRYHLDHGYYLETLRLTLPVSVRQPGDPPGGNRFVPVRFSLPVAEPDPVTRIRQVGALCTEWRHEPGLQVSNSIAGLLNLLPAPATAVVMGSMLKSVDFVATNVPGVPERCYLAGAECLRQFAFAPLAGAAINVSLVSHVGRACIGVNLDSRAVPDPAHLVDCIQKGIDDCLTLAWGEQEVA